MKLVGSLPILPERTRRGQVRPNNARDIYWHNLLTESIDSTRTMLLHAASSESLQVVMVTSALGGEGKTLLSGHLSASLARAGFKTLLIDGDLRRPTLHKLFNLELQPGLSEVLRGEADLLGATQQTPVPGLSVIPAGHLDAQSAQAMAQGELRNLFQQLKQQYDFVIVDSAPVLPVVDSQLIGQHVDGVLFSILRDVSRLPSVYAAYEKLSMLRIRILGAVVNGARTSSYGSGYYNYTSVPSPTAPAAS
jgi:capsular exopolysaccharide synthesis family protein